MACFVTHDGKRYTAKQFEKFVNANPDGFIEHVATAADIKTQSKPDALDALFESHKEDIQQAAKVEIPEDVQKQLEDAERQLTTEEKEAINGLGSLIQSGEADGGESNKATTETVEPDSKRQGDGQTIKPLAEGETAQKTAPKSDGLRKEPVSTSEGTGKLKESDVVTDKANTIDLANGFKLHTEPFTMPDGEQGIRATIEKPDGELSEPEEYVDTHDLVDKTNKQLKGYGLKGGGKKVAEPAIKSNVKIGETVSFEVAGSEVKGVVEELLPDGRARVKEADGTVHKINSAELNISETEPTTITIKSEDSKRTVEVKIKKKAKEANAKAEEKGISLKEQKNDLVNKMQTAVSVIGDAEEITPEIEKELEGRGIKVRRNTEEVLKSDIIKQEKRVIEERQNVKTAKAGKKTPEIRAAESKLEAQEQILNVLKRRTPNTQLNFKILGDGEVNASIENLPETLEMTKKEFPEREQTSQPKPKGISGPSKNLLKSVEDLDTARENLKQATEALEKERKNDKSFPAERKERIAKAEGLVKVMQEVYDEAKIAYPEKVDEERPVTKRTMQEVKEAKPISKTYYTTTNDSGFLRAEGAKPVELNREGDFFIHKHGKEYKVSEAKSGALIARGDSKEEAISNANATLDKYGDKLDEEALKYINKKGLSPRYTEETRFQKESTSEPITKEGLTRAIEIAKSNFPNLEITNKAMDWITALHEAKKETGVDISDPNGFVWKGKLYLNPDISKIKGDTVFHEVQHVANEVMKTAEPERWAEGKRLALQEGAIDKLRELYPHLKTDDEIADEFLADATGKRVEQLNEELQKAGIADRIINQITDWARQAKNWAYDKLGLTSDMTFNEFVDALAREQLDGKNKEVVGSDKLQAQKKDLIDVLNENEGESEPYTKEEQAAKEEKKKRIGLSEKQVFGTKASDHEFLDKEMAKNTKSENIAEENNFNHISETRSALISTLKAKGVWKKESVMSDFAKDADVAQLKADVDAAKEKLKVANESKDIEAIKNATKELHTANGKYGLATNPVGTKWSKGTIQRGVDVLRGAIGDYIDKIGETLYTEAGKENKKAFQLRMEMFSKDLKSEKAIPTLKAILKDLNGEEKLFDIPETDLTPSQKEAKRFFTDVMQFKTQADYIKKTAGGVIDTANTFIPKEEVQKTVQSEHANRFPAFDKFAEAHSETPVLKNLIPLVGKYVRATSGVTGFGKWLTGTSDGLINAGLKAASQAAGKAFRIKQTAEDLAFNKKDYEKRGDYENAKAFEKTKPVDLNKIAGKDLVAGGLQVSPKELNHIYLTLRQADVNKSYFQNERSAERLSAELPAKQAELDALSKQDTANLKPKQKAEIKDRIEELTHEIQSDAGRIDELKKGVQSFRFPAIEGVRGTTDVKITSEAFGKIREFAQKEFGEQNNGWQQAAEFIHPFIDNAFYMQNGIKLNPLEKFYPLIHGDTNDLRSYQKEQKNIDDFRSAKYRVPAPEGNNYLVLSSDITQQTYINSSSKYAAYSPVIRNMDAIMNGLEGHVSKDDIEWWNRQKAHAEDPTRFEGVIGEMGEREKKFYATFSTAVLGLNPFIPPKEIGAVFLATSEIESKYLLPQVPKMVADLGNLLKSFNPMQLRTYDAVEREMMQHNDMANMRLQSGITDYAELSKEMGKINIPNTDKVVDLSKATEPMLMAHRMVQKAYWESAKAKIDATQPELKGDAYWKAVGDIYEKVTLATQPSIDTFNGPSFRKDTNALTRALSLYGGQGFVNMNNVMSHVIDYMHNPESAKAKVGAAKAIANVFVLNTLMLTAIDAARPASGNDKKDKDKLFFDGLRNITKSVPIFSPVAEAVINKYQSPAFGYGVDLPILEVTNELAQGFSEVAKGKFDKAAGDFAKITAETTGVPLTPIELTKKALK